MTINQTLREADQKMDKAVEVTREEFAAIRAGRANPSMFSKITADYYGTPTPIQQLAGFTAPEARIILVQPYDMSALPAIERAIRDSDLGVNWRGSRRTARSARTTSPAQRSGSTAPPGSTPTRSTRCSSTRRPSCSKSELPNLR